MTSANSPHATLPPHRPGLWVSSPRTSYSGIINGGLKAWETYRADEGQEEEEEDDEDGEGDIAYDDDEDEFGLPSITSMRKKQNRATAPVQLSTGNPGGELGDHLTLGVGPGSNRQRANSSDIAEERGVSVYPTTKRAEGKILRPQYKEILRG